RLSIIIIITAGVRSILVRTIGWCVKALLLLFRASLVLLVVVWVMMQLLWRGVIRSSLLNRYILLCMVLGGLCLGVRPRSLLIRALCVSGCSGRVCACAGPGWMRHRRRIVDWLMCWRLTLGLSRFCTR